MIELSGQRFGRWLVTGPAERAPSGRRWMCRCDCGVERSVDQSHLTAGRSQSCGCLNLEKRIKGSSAANLRHGKTPVAVWNVWQGMRQRCLNPTHKSFPNYGGRGIGICARWQDFAAFRADMGERPAGMQIDRIDNEKGYEPGNCRWTTCKVQNRNRRSNRPISALGETKLIVEWAEDPRCAVSHQTLAKRLESGWAAERAITRLLRGSHA